MLINSCRDREDVRVEDDIFRRETGLLGQNPVAPSADFDPSLQRVRLPVFVKCHHDSRGAVSSHSACVGTELLLALLEADRVHDSLTLYAA